MAFESAGTVGRVWMRASNWPIAETDPVVMVINQAAPLGRLYQPQWLWTKLFCVKIF
jgi:hypothetical protein